MIRRTTFGIGKTSTMSSATLSTDVNDVIQRLKHSDYHNIDNSEASIRVAVELLILDRLL
ncbi:hypothetical protein N7497_006733 [Penicillium chrysogenum]|uniref:Uncharacterized protein n=1 Tax=Penicillium chrysogenum TaxID=5076 RepID=A0ABQ8W534_PENCH|nr:hypothetical protein N7505_010933 [Penicillium chrysogenum]KAJ6152414.1 hypothetical protein N7497_006733 [Penicillium chrysogenum]